MIDFIKATKILDKDTPFLGHCELEVTYNTSGWEKYLLHGCSDIELRWNPQTKWIMLQGSIMYYCQGHNFTFDKRLFFEAIQHINNLTKVDWWSAIVEVLEFGVIMEVQEQPKEYIKNHYAPAREKLTMNEKPQDKGCLKWWKDSNVSLKMYDENRNIKMKQSKVMQETIEEAGWNPCGKYLKWECHYIKPQVLNHGNGLKLCNLMNPKWECIFKEDLYLQYKRLIPMKGIIIPTDKKELSTPDILVLDEVQAAMALGETIEEVKKRKYDFINALPLKKGDKDARKRQVKSLFDKIEEESESKWDLSDKLQEALNKKD